MFFGPAQEQGGDELEFRALVHLSTRDVALVLERTRDRMMKYLRRRGLLEAGDDDGEEEGASERAGLTRLAACAPASSVFINDEETNGEPLDYDRKS